MEDVPRFSAARITSTDLTVHIVHARSEQEFDAAFVTLVPDALFTYGRQHLVELAATHRLPAIYTSSLFTEAGGLASYGTDQKDAYRQVGVYTGRILRGDKPSDLPVVQSVKIEFAINLKSAEALGLAIPSRLIARADEVIE